jgi:hypothetical protein
MIRSENRNPLFRIMLWEEGRPELTVVAGVRRKYEVRQPPSVAKANARPKPGIKSFAVKET